MATQTYSNEAPKAHEGKRDRNTFAVSKLAPFGCPQGVDPVAWRRSIEARLNELLDHSFALITALDMMEADPDLEDCGDLEPLLSWPEGGPNRLDPSMRHDDDREREDEHLEDGGDDEPNGDERDCDLAGATTDLEFCYGDYDGPGLIEGGQGQ